MKLNAYLHFHGQCEAAFKFYEKCLNGKIDSLFRYEGSPMAKDMPQDERNQVMHARLVVGDQVLMGSDVPANRYETPRGFSVTLNMSQPSEADRVFAALSENGQVHMPIQETFWAARFGMLVDQFGTPWMVNCEKAA
jgi:PhnB protein